MYHNDTSRYPPGYYEQQYNFDFFNYAGIHRPVFVYTTPKTYIDDITVGTVKLDDSGKAHLFYSVMLRGPNKSNSSVSVEVYDAQDHLVAQSKSLKGEIVLSNPNLWWPRGMHPVAGYLYTLKVVCSLQVVDCYLSARVFNLGPRMERCQ